VFKHR